MNNPKNPSHPRLDPPWSKNDWWTPDQLFPGNNISTDDRLARETLVYREDTQNGRLLHLVAEKDRARLKGKLETVSAFRLNEFCKKQDRARGILPPEEPARQKTQTPASTHDTGDNPAREHLKKKDQSENEQWLRSVPDHIRQDDPRRDALRRKLDIGNEVNYGSFDKARELEEFAVQRQAMGQQKPEESQSQSIEIPRRKR